MQSQSIILLGSTGSIGTSCLDVVRHHSAFLQMEGLVANRNVELLLAQAEEFRPQWVFAADESARRELAGRLPQEIRLLQTQDEVEDQVSASDARTVVSAVVGAAGLKPTICAARSGKRVALANKESLVVAGSILMEAACQSGAEIIPVDSEHSAVFQALQAGRESDLERIVLTASGGPFRGWSAAEMQDVTPEMALKHPTWQMGRKITVDSATMMNKALEIIEARWLFGISPGRISVVVHPQSYVHSFVEFRDGSVIAQMSPPDMRLPIQYALTWPERLPCPCPKTDWTKAMQLEFSPPDPDAFPALQLGYEVAASGGTSGVVLNAANEVAVERFLNHQIRFPDIIQICRDVLHHHTFEARPTLEQLFQQDSRAREEALRWTPS